MARFRKVDIEFWREPYIKEMSKEERELYLYFFTVYNSTQIGIYRIMPQQIAYDREDPLEKILSLMERLIEHHKVIRYNWETYEVALKYWGVVNLENGGKPMIDCIFKELKNVKDLSLIKYVAEMIPREENRNIFESVYKKELKKANEKKNNEQNAQRHPAEFDDTSTRRTTIGGQEEEIEKEIEKEKELQHLSLNPKIERNPFYHQNYQSDVSEIIAFWDQNGFGFSNINAKEQLLSWLDDSPFPQPKEVILKALTFACANNKRRLNYVEGILKHWANESLLTIEEISASQEKHRLVVKEKDRSVAPAGRYIPKLVDVDMTAGEA